MLINSKAKAFVKQGLSDIKVFSLALAVKKNRETRPVFIVGSGRSGTHFLARTLGAHYDVDDLTGGEENPSVFYRVTDAAIKGKDNIDLAIKKYKKLLRICEVPFFLDQTHPNLWYVEHLAEQFPGAFFIGITRRPEAVISSMLNHSGTADWTRRWNSFPVPNKFLGITYDNLEDYKRMDFVERSALRWLAHKNRMDEVSIKLGEKFLHIKYEDFAAETGSVMEKIENFLGLKSSIPLPKVKTESLSKWEAMDRKDIAKIRVVCGAYE